MSGGLPGAVGQIVSPAVAAGRALHEEEGLRIAAACGIAVPKHLVLGPSGAIPSLDGFAGDQVVVKALVPGLAHKSDAGAVAIVDRDDDAVAAARDEMAARLDHTVGFLIEEFIPHDSGPAGELLLGIRWSPHFGPVMTVGPGGTYAEVLGEAALIFRAGFPGPVTPFLRMATTGHRGARPVVPAEDLERAVVAMSGLAAAMPEHLMGFEINPLVFTESGPCALDAVAVGGTAPGPPVALSRPPDRLERLLHPQTIAVQGVSHRMNPGHVILRNVLAAGFPPKAVTVVKPGSTEIDGVRCVPDIASLDAPVDLMVLAVAAGQIPDRIDEIVAHEAAAGVLVIPGGLGERAGSEENAAAVAAALRRGRATSGGGPVVVGGNSMGIRSVPGRYDTFFIPAPEIPLPDPSPVAVLAQSGAFLLSRMDRLPWLRPGYEVSLGNQIDLTASDFMERFRDEPGIAVAACYLEGFAPGDGARWLDAAAAMRKRGAAVVLYLAGRTRAGEDAAASHTAAIAGDYATGRALAEQAGALVADTLEDFTDLVALAVLLRNRPVAGCRLGAVSNAGFECVAVADHLGALELAPLTAETRADLDRGLDDGGIGEIVAANNPLDVTPIAGDAAYVRLVAMVLDDPTVDVGLAGIVPFTPALETGRGMDETGGIREQLIDLWNRTTKPWVVVVDAGRRFDALSAALAAAGIPVFRTADRATRMLGRYCEWRNR